jgi:guanylate kinase
VVLAAPSGTGNTTLAHRLVRGSDRYAFSVSATTRSPRGSEQDGIDYHFLDREAFLSMVERDELAEWAEVHGRLYGTPKAELDEASRRGTHVVLDIDVQGARQVKEAVPDTKLVFVLPPSLEVLLERLRGRGTEEAADIGRRKSWRGGELRRRLRAHATLRAACGLRWPGCWTRIMEDTEPARPARRRRRTLLRSRRDRCGSLHQAK